MELLGALVSPGLLVVQVTVCPKNLWIRHWNTNLWDNPVRAIEGCITTSMIALAETYLEPSRTSAMKLLAVNYFR